MTYKGYKENKYLYQFLARIIKYILLNQSVSELLLTHNVSGISIKFVPHQQYNQLNHQTRHPTQLTNLNVVLSYLE